MSVHGALFAIAAWLAGATWYTLDLYGIVQGDEGLLPSCRARGIPVIIPCVVAALAVWPWLVYVDARGFVLRRVRVLRYRRALERQARAAVDEHVEAFEKQLDALYRGGRP